MLARSRGQKHQPSPLDRFFLEQGPRLPWPRFSPCLFPPKFLNFAEHATAGRSGSAGAQQPYSQEDKL